MELEKKRNLSKLEAPSFYTLPILEEIMELFTLIVYTLICGAITSFGIATNFINVICFTRLGFEDPVNISLLGLSLSDLGCLATIAMINFFFNPFVKAADMPFEPADVMYLVASMPHFAFSRISNLITAVIAVERCIAIMAPLKIKSVFTPRLTAVIIICIYIISVLSAVPSYVVNRLSKKFVQLRNKTVLGLIFMEDRETVQKISTALNNFSIPLSAFVIIVACTIILAMRLQKAALWRKQYTQSHENVSYSRNQKVAKMVVVISTLFIICCIPINVIMLIVAFEPELSYGGKYINVAIMLAGFSLILECINSSVNIFIYYHMSSKYRQTFGKLFSKYITARI